MAEWVFGRELSWSQRCWVSVLVGALTMLVGYGLERTHRRPDVPRTEDFAFWCYLFGLLAFWGGVVPDALTTEFGFTATYPGTKAGAAKAGAK